MQFEWDREKAAVNRRKHGVSFYEASTVFYDPLSATFEDPDHPASERRWVTVGFSLEARLLVVCHTDRHGAVRIINARRASPKERANYQG
jgi:uncharacterized DUF497 family protein